MAVQFNNLCRVLPATPKVRLVSVVVLMNADSDGEKASEPPINIESGISCDHLLLVQRFYCSPFACMQAGSNY